MLTEGEGFQGESWTVQCEVLQGLLKIRILPLGLMFSLLGALLICFALVSMDLDLLICKTSREGLICFLLGLAVLLLEPTEGRLISLLMRFGKDGQIMFRRFQTWTSMLTLKTHLKSTSMSF